MYQKTDSPEFAPAFLWQLCLLTVAALSFVYLSQMVFQPEKPSGVDAVHTILFPWVLAGGHTIENGLSAFSGKDPGAVNGRTQVKALSGLLLMSVVFPTVYFLNWRRRKLSSTVTSRYEPWTLSRVSYGLCGVITICFALAIGPVTVISELTRKSVREAQAVQTSRDVIIHEIYRLSLDVAQYYILPKELGGGAGNLEHFTLPKEMTKTDEGMYLAPPQRGSVVIHVSSVRYPNASVEVVIDSVGQMRGWNYDGEFK